MLRKCFQAGLFTCVALSTYFLWAEASAEVNDTGINVKWGYKGNDGPSHWGQLNPNFVTCAAGKMQSPINIIKTGESSQTNLVLHYQPAPLAIINDGHTELMLGQTQMVIDDGHGIQVNFSKETAESLEWVGQSYTLQQFHVHTPSENEWHGQTYPMEIHFVHQGDKGQVVVIGVFVKGGKQNNTLQKLINHFPKEKGKEEMIQGERINPIDLLPTKQDYYHFMGSLTTPPCTEGLQWIVMASAITASPAQIVEFKKAVGGANARPVQPLHGRVIFYSTTGSK